MNGTSPTHEPDDATAPVPAQAAPVSAAAADRGPVGEAAQDAALAVQERAPRTGTMVGSLVLILLGVGVVAVGLGFRLDLQAALIALLVIAGAALLVGALLSARRSR